MIIIIIIIISTTTTNRSRCTDVHELMNNIFGHDLNATLHGLRVTDPLQYLIDLHNRMIYRHPSINERYLVAFSSFGLLHAQ